MKENFAKMKPISSCLSENQVRSCWLSLNTNTNTKYCEESSIQQDLFDDNNIEMFNTWTHWNA